MATTLPLPFQDRVIAVTGASRGTGLALARYLLARGAKVSMAATSEETLAKALVTTGLVVSHEALTWLGEYLNAGKAKTKEAIADTNGAAN